MAEQTPEEARLARLATKYRARCLELETTFSTYLITAIKKIMASRSALPGEYKAIEERSSKIMSRGDLMETFIRSDKSMTGTISYEEFKQGLLMMGFMQNEEEIDRAFSKMDYNSDNCIDEEEFIRGTLGKSWKEENSFKGQMEYLLAEIRMVELKAAEDAQGLENLLLENETMAETIEEAEEAAAAAAGGLSPEAEAEMERLKNLVNDMTATHGDLQGQLKEELDREILRLREFGTAMRSQLNLLTREAVVGARSAARKVMAMQGATEEELDEFDRETERSQEVSLSRQVFINLDDQHMGDMDFDKFTQAYQWLAINASLDNLKHTFSRLDVQNTGLISEEQFLRAVCQDVDPSNYTARVQFAELNDKVMELEENLQGLVGPNVAEQLRVRLQTVRDQMNVQVGSIFSKVAGMTGMDVSEFCSPEVLEQHLDDAFQKFDHSGDDKLNFQEFAEAWNFLGLKGTGDELRDAFDQVDTDKSDFVDRPEFGMALKDNRLTELNMNILFEAMGISVATVQDRYASMTATNDRRRKQRKTMEATLAERMEHMVNELCSLLGKNRDASKAEEIREMRESFDRFDRNSSGELNMEEYKQAWKFLGRKGTDEDIRAAFNNVDIDNSGKLEWDEFVFSLAGEEAQRYGMLADMELLIVLLNEVANDIMVMRGERSDTTKELFATRERLNTLQREVTNRTETLVQRMKTFAGESMEISYLDDMDAMISDAFEAADAAKSGYINIWQFSQAWMTLGLGGSEEELKDLFQSVDRIGGMSSGMDLRQFLRVVKSERTSELIVRSRMASLEYLYGLIEGGLGGTADAKRRLERQKIDAQMFTLLEKMIDAVLPCTDDALSASYMSKKERHAALRKAFAVHDKNPMNGTLGYGEYVKARRAIGFEGTDAELQVQFDAVDSDGSGSLDMYEFIRTDMGKKASKVGCLGYVKILNKLLGTAVDRFLRGDQEQNAPSNKRNATRLNARKMIQRMTGFGGVDQKKLESLGIHVDKRSHSITAGMLEHILHDKN